MHSNLKEGGILALSTGNVESLVAKISREKWHFYNLPEHLWLFSPQTITRLLEENGFRVIELRNEWNYYSIDYIVERILKSLFKMNVLSRKIPFKKILQKIPLPVTLFDYMIVICQKVNKDKGE